MFLVDKNKCHVKMNKKDRKIIHLSKKGNDTMDEFTEHIQQPNTYLDSIQDGTNFKNQVVRMRNSLARKQTRWSVTENKLFICALSNISNINGDGWVTLEKADVVESIGIGSGHSGKELREQCQGMATKSWIKFGSSESEQWDDGFLVNRVKSDTKHIYIKFDKAYINYLKEVGKQWTTFQIGDISSFKSKYSIVLFQYLRSWYDPRYVINSQAISLINLKELFNLKEGQYVRKSGANKGKFDTSNFKKRTIDRAVEEINSITSCHMHIEEVKVVKKHGMVWGYAFEFSLLDDEGFRLEPKLK